MVKIRRITAIRVLSLLATVMTALALIVSPPTYTNRHADSDADAGAFADTNAAVNGALANDIHVEKSVTAGAVKEYLLKEASGYIGIFSPDDTENPQLITGIAISKLREADARMFREGVTVIGEEELAKLLEDFGS